MFTELIFYLETLIAFPGYQPSDIQNLDQELRNIKQSQANLAAKIRDAETRSFSHTAVDVLGAIRTMLLHISGSVNTVQDTLIGLIEQRERAHNTADILRDQPSRAAAQDMDTRVQAYLENIRSAERYRMVLSVWAERIENALNRLETITDGNIENAIRLIDPARVNRQIQNRISLSPGVILMIAEGQARARLAEDPDYVRNSRIAMTFRVIARTVQGIESAVDGVVGFWNFLTSNFSRKARYVALLALIVGLSGDSVTRSHLLAQVAHPLNNRTPAALLSPGPTQPLASETPPLVAETPPVQSPAAPEVSKKPVRVLHPVTQAQRAKQEVEDELNRRKAMAEKNKENSAKAEARAQEAAKKKLKAIIKTLTDQRNYLIKLREKLSAKEGEGADRERARLDREIARYDEEIASDEATFKELFTPSTGEPGISPIKPSGAVPSPYPGTQNRIDSAA